MRERLGNFVGGLNKISIGAEALMIGTGVLFPAWAWLAYLGATGFAVDMSVGNVITDKIKGRSKRTPMTY